MNLDADRFLERLDGYYARLYADVVSDMLVAFVRNNRTQMAAARNRLASIIASTMGAGEVLGASMVLRSAAKTYASTKLSADRGRLLAFSDQTIFPSVTLEEAVTEMVARVPVTLKDAAERTALRIAELYSESRVTAFVHAAEESVTEYGRSFIEQALKDGVPEGEAGRRLAMGVNEIRQKSGPWTEAYSRMAFRTNVNTAVTAGRFRQVQDKDIRQVIPCLQFQTAGDHDVRSNHGKLDGLVMRSDNREWARVAPPLGYNCRCQVALITLPQLRRMGRVKADGSIYEDRVPQVAGPDPGFRHGGRPDLFLL